MRDYACTLSLIRFFSLVMNVAYASSNFTFEKTMLFFVRNYYIAFKVSLQTHTKYMTLIKLFRLRDTMHGNRKNIELDLFRFESVRSMYRPVPVNVCMKHRLEVLLFLTESL